MAELENVRIVLLDLDGTVYEGTMAVAGAAAAVASLRDGGRDVRFTTNTDSIGLEALVERLAGMDIEAAPSDFVTPVIVARELFDRLQPPPHVLAVAAQDVRDALAGHLVGHGEPPTHVLVADPSYGATYDELDVAFRAVRAGAQLVATQMARIARRDDGEHLDTGGWVRLLEYAAEVPALVLGKPSVEFFGMALTAAGRTAGEALVVGDDVRADIEGGRAVGALTALVRTGKGGQPVAGAPEPDLVIDSVADLPSLLCSLEPRAPGT